MMRLTLACTTWLFSSVSSAAVQLPNTLCGPPHEVISAVESRGYVNEFSFNVILPAELTGREGVVMLAYLLGPEKAKEQHRKTSGVFSQSVAWVIRTDAEQTKPLGWACFYKDVPVTEKERREMLERATRVESAIKSR